MNNIPESITSKLGKNLHTNPKHPIGIVRNLITKFFEAKQFSTFASKNPIVSVKNNFDALRVPTNHPSRSTSDTFYETDTTCLRTHMTAYLPELAKFSKSYIICGDVYRKDAIDATHYPVFHQLDAFCLLKDVVNPKAHLRETLSELVKMLFGDSIVYRFLEDTDHSDVYFPFTVDSLEMEVDLPTETGIKKLEILGGGSVHKEIMKNLGLEGEEAWAFGMGLERISMAMFEIPDIRLFWSEDKRFLDQFEEGKITKFVPYSKYEKCWKDVSLFINDQFNYNELCSIARDADSLNSIESITLIDEFTKNDKTSHCYRIVYRSMDRTLTNEEVDMIQMVIRNKLVENLQVELR